MELSEAGGLMPISCLFMDEERATFPEKSISVFKIYF
jgi:hypothetical protein